MRYVAVAAVVAAVFVALIVAFIAVGASTLTETIGGVR